MVFISKQLPVTIIINDVSYEHDKLNQCFCYCLAEKAMTMKVHELRHIALFVKASGILFTVGNVDRDSGRYSGRHSVDSRLTLD